MPAADVHPIFLRVPREEIGYVKFIFESYEDVAITRTLDRHARTDGDGAARLSSARLCLDGYYGQNHAWVPGFWRRPVVVVAPRSFGYDHRYDVPRNDFRRDDHRNDFRQDVRR